MELIDYAFAAFGSFLTLLLQVLCYKEFTQNPRKIKAIYILFLVTTSIIIVLNTYFNNNYSNFMISFIIVTINCYVMFKEHFNTLLLKVVSVYIIVVITEVLISIVIAVSNINNLLDFNTNVLVKVIFSSTVMIISLSICKNRHIKQLVNKIINISVSRITYVFFLMLSLIFATFLAYRFMVSFNTKSYLVNLVLLICFMSLLLVSLYNYMKTKKVEEQQETLLKFMSKYEKMIDDDRINRHEMLNNLIILSSYKNKNTNEYTEILNDLINMYSKNKDTIKNIYNLPSGLKGVLYYKVNDMKAMDIKVAIKISKQACLVFNKFTPKEYNSICRIIAILLDNARDAAANSDEKMVIIDFFNQKDKFIIQIDNTFIEKVNMKKLSTMNYSTKGKGRGLGLFIAKSLAEKSDFISLEQKIIDNQYFSSNVIIDIKRK